MRSINKFICLMSECNCNMVFRVAIKKTTAPEGRSDRFGRSGGLYADEDVPPLPAHDGMKL